MLVSFSVANYRSFGEEVTLNMVASNKLPDHPNHRVPLGDTGKSLVRSAVLYGANGSGKSNLVKAMRFAQRLITWRQPDRLPPVDFFRFQPDGASKPSSFEFRFLIGERVFIYGFDVAPSGFLSEWLAVKKGGDEVLIFERDAEGKTESNKAGIALFPDDGFLRNTLKALTSFPVRPNQLFLNQVSSLPDDFQGETVSAAIRWLTKELVILEGSHRSPEILDRLHQDKAFRDFTEELLRKVDTGVGGLEIEEKEQERSDQAPSFLEELDAGAGSIMLGEGDADVRIKSDDPSRYVVRELIAQHLTGGRKYTLPFGEESDGTKQLFHFAPLLFGPPGENKVFVIDELDSSLHPLLCWEMIKFFCNESQNPRRQLIVTTHESHLLNQDLLRRDEYWFVEKDNRKQQTQLTSLSDFKIRKDLEVRKGYLQGRFGGIPVFGAMDELVRLLKSDSSEGRHAAQEPATR